MVRYTRSPKCEQRPAGWKKESRELWSEATTVNLARESVTVVRIHPAQN